MNSKKMNHAKKVLSILAALIMLTALAACGGTQTAPEETGQAAVGTPASTPKDEPKETKPVTIAMVTWIQETNQKAIDTLNAAFAAKYPDVKITVDTAPDCVGSQQQKHDFIQQLFFKVGQIIIQFFFHSFVFFMLVSFRLDLSLHV